MCRAFTAGECDIADEMVFNHPITYSDFLDAVDVYPYLTGIKMDRILNLILSKIDAHNKDIQVLVAMSKVPWANLKVDEIVYVSDDFDAFTKGKAIVRHYCQIDSNDEFQVYSDGKSSATTMSVSNYKYSMPKSDYEKLALQK